MKIITMYIENSNLMYGGAYRRYMELIEGFITKGWEVHHISPHGFSNIKHHNFNHHGVSKVPISPSYLPFMMQVIPKAINICRKDKIDAIITFSLFDAFIGIITGVFYRKTKIILCDRGDSVKGILINLEKYKYINTFASFFLKKFENFVYKNTDTVIFNTNLRKRTLIKRIGSRNNFYTVYNNANPSWVINKVENAHELAGKIKRKWKGKRILCFIGNLFIKGRDLDTLLKAFKIVKKSVPNSVLLIIGDGPDKEKLIDIRNSLGLDDTSVSIEGWQENPFSYMVSSDVNIVTAMHEGCSNTILEASYCGNVILGTRIGGIPELLKYEELMFPPKNEVEIAKKIINLLKNKEELIKARKLTKKRGKMFIFDWNEIMMNSIENIVYLDRGDFYGKNKSSFNY